MKREGRQHGAVRSHPILPIVLSHQRRHVKRVDSPSVSGLFTKVSTKPTNDQSKFTRKCGTALYLGSRIYSGCKSKDKTAKGSMKLRSDDEMISCPNGTSAIDALAYLAREYNYEAYDDYDDNVDHLELELGGL